MLNLDTSWISGSPLTDTLSNIVQIELMTLKTMPDKSDSSSAKSFFFSFCLPTCPPPNTRRTIKDGEVKEAFESSWPESNNVIVICANLTQT